MGAYVNAADPRGVSLLPASVIAEIASLGLNLAGSLCCAAFCSGRFFLGDVHPLFCFFCSEPMPKRFKDQPRSSVPSIRR